MSSQSPSMPSYDLLVHRGEREGEEEEEDNDTNPHCAVGEGRVLGDAHPRFGFLSPVPPDHLALSSSSDAALLVARR